MTEPAIDTGEILEALNDKVDRDCRNVDTTSGADVVIEWQAPTAENGYTWYRKYKSGWVEQGGIIDNVAGSTAPASTVFVYLPLEMADYNYTTLITGGVGSSGWQYSNGLGLSNYTRTYFEFFPATGDGGRRVNWEVKGFAAQS